jgi:hypothetical protein
MEKNKNAICDVCGRNTEEFDIISTKSLSGIIICSEEMSKTCKANKAFSNIKDKEALYSSALTDIDIVNIIQTLKWDMYQRGLPHHNLLDKLSRQLETNKGK